MSKLLPISKAFETVTGSRPHPSTICRYALRGCKGVQLETWMVGGQRRTTVEAVEKFIKKLTELNTPAIASDSGRKVGK
jgi:Protein of unknown function (DUF1580)